MEQKSGVSRSHHRSLAQKTGFAVLHLGIVLLALWLVLFDGLSGLPGGLHFSDPTRARILLGCILLYFVRHMITLFYLLQRAVLWSEALGLIGFFAAFELGMLLLGGGVWRATPIALNWLDAVALGLVLCGSYLNTGSEIQRKWWKADPANKGHCYTQGLFRHAMHINFFGDMVLFTGWVLFTHNPWALALPLLMTGMFVFLHIPGLDAYLAERYGDAFTAYAARTKKLIPWLY